MTYNWPAENKDQEHTELHHQGTIFVNTSVTAISAAYIWLKVMDAEVVQSILRIVHMRCAFLRLSKC